MFIVADHAVFPDEIVFKVKAKGYVGFPRITS